MGLRNGFDENVNVNENVNDNVNDNENVNDNVNENEKGNKMKQSARNFHNYQVWQDAVAFATLVYETTSLLPSFEKRGLCDQLQRAVVSISSNIAEGAGRPTDADFAHFLDLSLGSSNEVETQLLISKNLRYITNDQYDNLMVKLIEIQKQLTGLIASIRK